MKNQTEDTKLDCSKELKTKYDDIKISKFYNILRWS